MTVRFASNWMLRRVLDGMLNAIDLISKCLDLL